MIKTVNIIMNITHQNKLLLHAKKAQRSLYIPPNKDAIHINEFTELDFMSFISKLQTLWIQMTITSE